MPDTPGSLIRRAATVACLIVIAAAPAFAQAPAPPSPSPDFLTRYDFHLAANVLAIDDPRFSWETHFGGDLDVVDYVVGRASIVVDYQAILGDQLRPFDPNQSYYVLEASSSLRVPGVEIAGVFHHVSRHLSDRDKTFPVAWNIIGARALRRFEGAGVRVDAYAGAGVVAGHSNVDYRWTADLDLSVRRAIAPHVEAFASGHGDLYGVDGTGNRGRQTGGRAEAGVRFNGRAGALELFAGVERRVDADPIDFQAQRWAIAGFRLVSR
ncbi:MAG: hypothetical protein ABI868_05565 [Acidobacteriota bacterium]